MPRNTLIFLLCFPLLFLLPSAVGAKSGGAPEVEVLKIWPEGPPHSKVGHGLVEETFVSDGGNTMVRNVTDPELWVYPLAPEHASGASVLIFPGGGYWVLAIDHEGYAVRDWLSKLGITPIIVKYRHPWDTSMEDPHWGPLMDAQEAVRIVRRNAGKWGLDPDRIGVLGFSAGGHLAASVSNLPDKDPYGLSDGVSARPDFSVLVYPVISFVEPFGHAGSEKKLLGSEDAAPALQELFSLERQVDANTPPAFLVHAADDQGVPAQNSLAYFESMLGHGIPGELHVIETGGHGFGLGNWEDCSFKWPSLCESWLRRRELVK